MDDPWGSPWADELHQSIPAPATKGTTNGVTLTPLLQGKEAATTEKTNTPWDAPGDGFGSWASPPVVQEITEDGSTSSTLPTWETPRAGDIKKIDVGSLSPNWDASQPGSGHSTPKLSPTPLSKPPELLRQPSPDPWATVASSPDADPKVTPEELGQDEENNAQSMEEGKLSDTSALEMKGGSATKPEGSILPTPTENSSATETAPEERAEDTKKAIEVPEQDKDGKDTDEVSRSSSSPSDHSNHNEIHSESPRTSLDDDTQRPEVHRHVSEKIQVLVEHYDALAKSQLEEDVIITKAPHSDKGDTVEESHEEESTSEIIPEVGQKQVAQVNGVNISDEVKGEKEDKLESEVADKAQIQDENQAEDEDEDDDFGDFEEGTSQISESTRDEEEQSPNHHAEQVLDGDKPQTSDEPTVPVAKAQPVHVPERDFGRVEYPVDTAALDKLYPGLKPEPPVIDPADNLFIPDTVPHDSFTSVEERKMWYRLSRYTTLRQHNSGDDDNTYIRVSWAESKVREETLKFAGKWMEQDRISGRVVLGGNSKDGSLFGWNDPKAAPMPLATAFAMTKDKKKPQVAATGVASSKAPKETYKSHAESRPPSQSSSPQKQRRRSSTKAPRTSEEAKQKTQLPVASFGWSSEPQPSAALPILNQNAVPQNPPYSQKPSPPAPQLQPASNIFASTGSTQQIPSSFSGWDAPPSPAKEPVLAKAASVPLTAPIPVKAPVPAASSVPAMSTVPAKPPVSVIPSTADDFDDDWGEMISSPVVVSPPQVPPVPTLRHKKSQSLVGTSLPPSQAPASNPSLPSIPLGSGHRPTSSLDGSSTSNPFSMNANAPNAFNAVPKNAASPLSSNFDPWASADFSVFDTPAPPPQPKSAPPPKSNLVHTHRQGAKSVTFESTRAPPPRRGNGRTREEMEQDRVVASIINGLPDLSYMMRR